MESHQEIASEITKQITLILLFKEYLREGLYPFFVETKGESRITSITKAYVNYFMGYPGIFDLFFVEKLGTVGKPEEMGDAIYSFLDYLCDSDWNEVRELGKYSEQEIEIKQKQLNYITAGMFLFYMNRMQPSSCADFQRNLDEQLELVFAK